MNTVKPKPAEPVQETEQQKQKKIRRRKTSAKFMKALNVFGMIEKDMLAKILPFVFFLTGFALIYIANSYYAEKTIREIDKTTKDLKELRSEYISTKSDLMIKSNQTQVADAVLPVGLKESRVAPKKIVVKDQTKNKKTD